MPFRKFAVHHDHMVDLADTILSLARCGSPDALQQLQTNRIALSRTVAEHCAAEIAQMPQHSHDPQTEPEKAALVRRYHSELLAWRGSLMECNANWPTRRIADEPAAFAVVFGRIADQLRDRVRWEEDEFYPAIFGTRAMR